MSDFKKSNRNNSVDKSYLIWRFQKNQFDLKKRPLIMGVLNVTPDSFSDGGDFYELDKAVEQALKMVDEGADLIDVGGESTRPGSRPITVQEELDRIVPVIEAIKLKTNIPISIDTYKSKVAKAAVKAGASIINDISGARFDPQILSVAQKYDTGLILMHIKGSPKNMQTNPTYSDVVEEIIRYLKESVSFALQVGIPSDHIVIDPGIGFGKRWFDNYDIINRLNEFFELDLPVLIGASRKSFLGKFLSKDPKLRLEGSLTANVLAAQKGANILRTHDVKETRQALTIANLFYKRSLGVPPEILEESFSAGN